MEERSMKQLLMSSNYFVLNKQLVKALGIETAFLLTTLIETSDSLADDEGWFYCTIEKIEEITGLKRRKQESCFVELVEKNILVQENRGVPCKRYFKISYESIENLVFKNVQTRLHEKDKLDCTKEPNKFVQKSQTSLDEMYKLDCTKEPNSYKEYKELNINNLNKELKNNNQEEGGGCPEISPAVQMMRHELFYLIGTRKLDMQKIIMLNKPISRIREVFSFANRHKKADGWLYSALKEDWKLEEPQKKEEYYPKKSKQSKEILTC